MNVKATEATDEREVSSKVVLFTLKILLKRNSQSMEHDEWRTLADYYADRKTVTLLKWCQTVQFWFVKLKAVFGDAIERKIVNRLEPKI